MLKKIQLLFACYLFKYSDDVDNIWKEHILYTAYQLEDFQKEAYNYEKNSYKKISTKVYEYLTVLHKCDFVSS